MDRHVTALVVTVGGGATLAGYAIAIRVAHGPVLLGRLDGHTRSDLFGSLAATSGALLGFLITSLSILIGLPASGAVGRLRRLPAWVMLASALLMAAVLSGLTLVLTTVGLALDRHEHPKEWFEALTASASVAAALQLLVAGTAFALVVVRAPSD